MKALREKFPALVHTKDDQTELSVRFLNPSPMNQQVLNLGTGFSGMMQIINGYESRLKFDRFLPLEHPVIFIVDNDKGGANVLKEADKISQQDVKPASNDAFFHIQRNLYLVKTPPNTDGSLSAFEDCFPEEVLKQELNGKRLDLKKKHGDETNFGKQVFAEQIVRPGVDKIDFSNFSPILDGISKAIIDNYTRHSEVAERSASKFA